MKIGLVSDSHGNDRVLSEAVKIFAERNVRVIVHCGDIGSPQGMAVLGSSSAVAYMVAGNIDHKLGDLETLAQQNNLHFAWEVAIIPIDDHLSLAATHGDDQQTLGGLILSQRFPYVCHGHTHHQRDDRVGATRVINPGALSRARQHSVAVLDTDTDMLEFIEITSRTVTPHHVHADTEKMSAGR